jgi:hypothetical protein
LSDEKKGVIFFLEVYMNRYQFHLKAEQVCAKYSVIVFREVCP